MIADKESSADFNEIMFSLLTSRHCRISKKAGRITLKDAQSSAVLQSFQLADGEVLSARFHATGEKILVVTESGVVVVCHTIDEL